MAYIGLRKPYVAALNKDGTYGTPKTVGKAVATNISPNYAEGTLYGDDGKAEEDYEFTDATVTAGFTTVPKEFAATMYGHTVKEDGEIVYNADDQAGYVGYGIIGVEKVNGVKSFVATFMPKVKFKDPGVDWNTKGESITYSTPSVEGKATTIDGGDWKYDKVFETEAAAEAYILGKFGAAA